jgi:hypothetical protein
MTPPKTVLLDADGKAPTIKTETLEEIEIL